MARRNLFLAGGIFVCGIALFIGNSNKLTEPPKSSIALLAHKAVGQAYNLEGVGNDDCTATRMLPPRHAFLENTIPSIAEAFKLGADRVEIDIHPTTDGQFAVFHDWTLDCRTNGTGQTRDQSMANLKTLDVGFGYTSDKGITFPFRGKGVGMMPSLAEVLAAFPNKKFFINMKSNDPNEGKLLAEFLKPIPETQLSNLAVFGGIEPISVLQNTMPAIQTMSRTKFKSCIATYAALGWSGFVPRACRNTLVFVPINIGPWLWGWPHLFQQRMEAHGSFVYVMAPTSGGFSRGIDTAEALATLPDNYRGGISTDAIDIITPLLKR